MIKIDFKAIDANADNLTREDDNHILAICTAFIKRNNIRYPQVIAVDCNGYVAYITAFFKFDIKDKSLNDLVPVYRSFMRYSRIIEDSKDRKLLIQQFENDFERQVIATIRLAIPTPHLVDPRTNEPIDEFIGDVLVRNIGCIGSEWT